MTLAVRACALICRLRVLRRPTLLDAGGSSCESVPIVAGTFPSAPGPSVWCIAGMATGERGGTPSSTTASSAGTSAALEEMAALAQIGPYVLGKELGRGSFACVRAAIHSMTDESVSCDSMSCSLVSQRCLPHRTHRRRFSLSSLECGGVPLPHHVDPCCCHARCPSLACSATAALARWSSWSAC